MSDEDLNTVTAMIRYGGGFVKALGQAATKADSQNLDRIKAAFPEYWRQYSLMSGNAQPPMRCAWCGRPSNLGTFCSLRCRMQAADETREFRDASDLGEP